MRWVVLAGVAMMAGAGFGWGDGHDAVARCLLKKLPRELVGQMKGEWKALYEEASHLPDAGRHELLNEPYRGFLEKKGWKGTNLHKNRFNFWMFDCLVEAVKRGDAYGQLMLLAAISHVAGDPAACNHNPVVQCGLYIWGDEGYGIFGAKGLEFSAVEETEGARAVMERRLRELEEEPLPERLGFAECYEAMVALQWEAAELCSGRGSDVMAHAAAFSAGDAGAEEPLAEALCDLGMFAVRKTLWLYRAAARLAGEGAEPPEEFDEPGLTAKVEKAAKEKWLRRPFGADGYLREYLPEEGKRQEVRVLCDSIAHMNFGVMTPASRILAPQTVESLRRLFPERGAALIDVREVAERGVDPGETKLLVAYGGKFSGYLGFDAEKMLREVVKYRERGGKVLWVDGRMPEGLADGLAAAMIEPNPRKDKWCCMTYPVPQRELAGAALAWTGEDAVEYGYKRIPTGMAGWYWTGARWAFDLERLPGDAAAVVEFRTRRGTWATGAVWPKGDARVAWMPANAFFPYALTRERPEVRPFRLRLDSAGEAFLKRAVETVLGK